MDNKMEILYKQIQQRVEEKNPKTEEEFSKAISDLMKEYNAGLKVSHSYDAEEQSFDFLQKAQEASSPEKALRFVEKSLKCNPDNVDAKVLKAALSSKNMIEILEKYDEIITDEENKLRSEGFFDNPGEFWLMFETRPYMRALAKKVDLLKDLDRVRDAIKLCERMLELCNNDNLGARYQLMSLYAQMEDLKGAERLYKRYSEEETVGLLLPLCFCYYRCGNYTKCRNILKKLYKCNSHVEEMLKDYDFCEFDCDDYYSPGDESEVRIAFDNCYDLMMMTLSFFDFISL